MFLHHFREVAADAQLGHVGIVQCKVDGAVVFGLDDEVGHNLLQVFPYGLAQRGAGTRIEFAKFLDGMLELVFADAELLLYLVPMLAGEIFVAVTDDVSFQS